MSTLPWDWFDLLKLLLAVLAGALVGLERAVHHKPAGLTTMVLVTLSSTLAMELSYRLALLGSTTPIADPARLAAAVLTGIGFLGAGVIIRSEGQVHGVTTAAAIWLMAGVGLAIGAGFYLPAAVVVVLALFSFGINPYTSRLISTRNRLFGLPSDRDNDEQGGS